jgi:hypothetical protein
MLAFPLATVPGSPFVIASEPALAGERTCTPECLPAVGRPFGTQAWQSLHSGPWKCFDGFLKGLIFLERWRFCLFWRSRFILFCSPYFPKRPPLPMIPKYPGACPCLPWAGVIRALSKNVASAFTPLESTSIYAGEGRHRMNQLPNEGRVKALPVLAGRTADVMFRPQ